MSVEIILVPSPAVEGMWPAVAAHLEPSIAMSYGCFEPVDVMALCMGGQMQLWVAVAEDEVLGATVTEIVDYPRRRAARVAFAGGKELTRWYGPMDEAVEAWCRTWGCTAMMAGGRKGWARLAKSKDIGVLLWRDLDPVREVH